VQGPLTIGIIGDFNPAFAPHQATNDALQHSGAALASQVEGTWLPTRDLEAQVAEGSLFRYHGLWCAPGSPYESLTGALAAVRFAREHDVPFIGTCAGFQHAAIEYARNVMGITDADHAEYDPYASRLFVTALACSLVGQTLHVSLQADSAAARSYGRTEIDEQYYCNFGLDPQWQPQLHDAGLRVVGVDDAGEARVLELPRNRFFVATLFVPQARSRPGAPHPLVTAYVQAAQDQRARGGTPNPLW
jgi:CTP synthase (UTP-ammonia lyase)